MSPADQAGTGAVRHDLFRHATRWDAALVEATMLWPDDEQMRWRSLAATAAALVASPTDDTPLHLPNSQVDLKRLALFLRMAPRPDEFREDAKARFVWGLSAGFRLHRAVNFAGNPAMATATQANKDFCDRLAGTWQIRPKTLDNQVWKKFRCVAHLWAAYRDPGRAPTFDGPLVQPAGLAVFLDLAERYRLIGESTRGKQSAGTVLKPGEAVVLPPGKISQSFGYDLSQILSGIRE